jgi:ubiquitin C-terminal hydrolase
MDDLKTTGGITKKKRVFKHGCSHLRHWTSVRKAGSLLASLNALVEDSKCPITWKGSIVCAECELEATTPSILCEKHSHRGSSRHAICFDRARMHLFCMKCSDYVYMEEYEALLFAAGVGFQGELGVLSELRADAKKTGQSTPTPPGSPAGTSETGMGEEGDRSASGGLPCGRCINDSVYETSYREVKTGDGWPAGLRGINNMGNTCFMNAILQAFIRTPFLSDHYLSANHCEGNCRVSAEGGHCLECQLDMVISDVFSGNRTPYSPCKFLYTWWMMAGGFLSGYKQQDAHEFFLFILQMLTGHPDNIATSLFIGQVQSRVICQSCGRNSVQKDEFSHLSLDVLPPSSLLPKAIATRTRHTGSKKTRGGRLARGRGKKASRDRCEESVSNSAAVDSSLADKCGPAQTGKDGNLLPAGVKNAKGASWSHPALAGYLRWPGDSLIGCLRRFTFAEVLDGASQDWRCPNCNSADSRAVRQTSITKLPPVLTMHLKRFEFSGGYQARARKLETFVSFPLDGLDMSPYLTSRIDLGRHGVGAHHQFLYDAFAVICHRGTCQGGHYVAYVRCNSDDNEGRKRSRWFLCDDGFVTEVDAKVVANCQAYMIFYGLKN